MSPVLSIVMPSLSSRAQVSHIAHQIEMQTKDLGDKVEFFELRDNGVMSTGKKLQVLYGLCSGEYICGIGDDDVVEDDYVVTLLDGIRHGPVDMITFRHSYFVNGEWNAEVVMKPGEDEWQDGDTHYRLPSPLCPVKRDIVLGFDCPDKSDKEDCAFKDYLRWRAETSYDIPHVLYHHMWSSPDNANERDELRHRWKRG